MSEGMPEGKFLNKVETDPSLRGWRHATQLANAMVSALESIKSSVPELFVSTPGAKNLQILLTDEINRGLWADIGEIKQYQRFHYYSPVDQATILEAGVARAMAKFNPRTGDWNLFSARSSKAYNSMDVIVQRAGSKGRHVKELYDMWIEKVLSDLGLEDE